MPAGSRMTVTHSTKPTRPSSAATTHNSAPSSPRSSRMTALLSAEVQQIPGQGEEPPTQFHHRDAERNQDDRHAQHAAHEPHQGGHYPEHHAQQGSEEPEYGVDQSIQSP